MKRVATFAAVHACLIALALLSCAQTKSAAGEVGGAILEYVGCPVIPGLDCGHVFVCATPADNALGLVELCIDDDNDKKNALADAEAVYGQCEPTPRHRGICVFCPEDRGCNAFNGCFGCPTEEP